MGSPQEESWWLDKSNDSVMWARLRVPADGAAEVFDLDGKRHHFASKQDAVLWLLEDEYFAYRDAVAEGEIPRTVLPPEASTEAELVCRWFFICSPMPNYSLKRTAATACGILTFFAAAAA